MNISMKMIQKTQKQVKHLKFQTLHQKYYQMMIGIYRLILKQGKVFNEVHT